jgi:hypothetical protein
MIEIKAEKATKQHENDRHELQEYTKMINEHKKLSGVIDDSNDSKSRKINDRMKNKSTRRY